MAKPDFSVMWKYNYYSRNPKYTMRGELLPSGTPVGSLVCLSDEIDIPLKPLTNYPLIMNWETGLSCHSRCGKPTLNMVQNCNGCFEDFWGFRTELYCKECLPYA